MNGRLVIAGLFGAAGVILAAFGAHALPASMPERLRHAYETGADFHLLHAVLLAAVALAGERPRLRLSFYLLLVGALVFSVSLYALALTGVTALGAITPIGGIITLVGWLALVWAGAKTGSPKASR